MEITQFLELVWPETGPYLTAIPVSWTDKETGRKKKGFRHFPHDSVQAAATHAGELAYDREAPKDVYFALGSIKDATTKHKRSGTNIDRLRAFWLDIDIKPEPGNYVTRSDAAAALRAFCKNFGMPKPWVVNSGGGFHVYWPLTESIDAEQWQHYASILKAVTKSAKFMVDQTRTADRASVLRPVGSLNWKTGEARPVELVMEGAISTPKQLLACLSRMGEGVAVQEVKVSRIENTLPTLMQAVPEHLRGATAAVNEAAQAGLEKYKLANPKRVVKACQQLRRHIEQPENIAEPEWYAMVGCLRHADRGPDAVHALSKRYPTYDAGETEDKIAQHELGGFGPTLCETFEGHNPGGCDGCPFRGKIKSPIQLGRERVELETPKLKLSRGDAEVEIDLPDPPAPFKRALNTETGKACVVMQVFEDFEVVDEVEIFPFDLYPSKLVYDERDSKFRVGITLWLPHRGEVEFFMDTGTLYDRRALATQLGNKGALPDLGKVEHLVQYMIAYIRELQKKSAGATVFAQLGWRADGSFVLPGHLVTAAGLQDIAPSAPVDNALEWNKYPPKGDLETWKHAVSVLERPGLEPLQFGFGVGFASPLLQFTDHHGMLVSLHGTKGTGKSSAARCANSIWGHTKMGWVDIEHDTVKAFYNKLGVLNHLPATYDEITNLEPSALSDLCYAISKGRGRQRLRQDGTAQENHGGWQTMMITTANASLHSRLSLAKDDASAEAVRVFEYAVPSGTMTKADADSHFGLLKDNHGLAGPVYALAMTQRRDWVAGRVEYWNKLIDEKADVKSGERFWSAGAACVLAGFELANSVGLTNANIERLLAFSLHAIERMRANVEEVTSDAVGSLGEYLARNIRCVLSVNAEPTGNGPAMVGMEPLSELRIRAESYSKRMYIDRAHIRKFLNEASLDYRAIMDDLKERGILLEDCRRIALGKGTKWRTSQSYCWVLDLGHPAMGDNAVAAVSRAGQANVAQ